VDVLIYTNPDDPSKRNRGFAFLDYDNHKNASAAKRKMESGQVAAWGRQFVVSWAEPQEEPDAETMAKVCFALLFSSSLVGCFRPVVSATHSSFTLHSYRLKLDRPQANRPMLSHQYRLLFQSIFNRNKELN